MFHNVRTMYRTYDTKLSAFTKRRDFVKNQIKVCKKSTLTRNRNRSRIRTSTVTELLELHRLYLKKIYIFTVPYSDIVFVLAKATKVIDYYVQRDGFLFFCGTVRYGTVKIKILSSEQEGGYRYLDQGNTKVHFCYFYYF